MTTGNGKFDKDLDRVEESYRAISGDEPPDLLDQAVLNKAREAVRTPAVRPWSFGWIHATATAALLVLGLSIVMQQPSQFDAAPAKLDRSEPVRSESFQDRAAMPAPGISASGEFKQDQPVVMEDRFTDQEPIPETEPVGSSIMVTGSPIRKDTAKQAAKTEKEVDEAGFREVDAPLEETAESTSDASAEVKNRQRRANEETSREVAGQQDSGVDELRQAADKRQSMAAAAPPLSTPASADDADEIQRNQPAPVSADLSFSVSEAAIEHPDDWISRILDLKHQEGNEDWEAELEMFRETYPDYPLPEELNLPAEEDPDGP